MTPNSTSNTDIKKTNPSTKNTNPATKATTATVPIRSGKADPSVLAPQPTAASRGRPDAPQTHNSASASRSLSKSQAQNGGRTASPAHPPSQKQQGSGQEHRQNRTASPAGSLTLETFGTVSPPKVLKDEKRPKPQTTPCPILTKARQLYAENKLEGYD